MRFSIVIASYNRPARLRSCLEAVSGLSYSESEFEAIVVDDGSPQPLQDSVTALPFDPRFAPRFFRQRNSGPAKARNVGAENARGEWLVFLDDDCSPRQDWLRAFDRAAQKYPRSLLGGCTRNGCFGNACAETNQRLLDFVVDWFEKAGSPLQFFPSNNMAVPARTFREIGGG